MLQPVGVFAIAAIGGPARGLHIGGAPGLRAERAQSRGRVECARAHFDIIGLQDETSLLRPVILQRQNEVLKCPGLAHDSGSVHGGPGPYRRGLPRASEALSRST